MYGQGGDESLHREYLQLAQSVLDRQDEIERIKKNLVKLYQDKVKKAEVEAEVVPGLQEGWERRDGLLKELALRSKLIEGAMLKVRPVSSFVLDLLTPLYFKHKPSRTAVTILIELDDIRLCIASAFAIAFPAVYTKKDMIITYAGDKREKLVWSLFKRKLSAHFGSYHRVKKHDNGWALYTCRSPFDDIDRSTAVLDAFNASVDTRGTYVAQCDGQGRIAESEEDFFKRILGFFHPVLRSLCEKSKECFGRVSGRLVAWREDLNMNEGATRDARDRRTALNTSVHYYVQDGDGNLWACLGRGEPSAHAEAIHDQDDSGASLTISHPRRAAGRGATHGQDDSGASLATSPP